MFKKKIDVGTYPLEYSRRFESEKGIYLIEIRKDPEGNHILTKYKNAKMVEQHNLSAINKDRVFYNSFKNGPETAYITIDRVNRGDQKYLKLSLEINRECTSKYDVTLLM